LRSTMIRLSFKVVDRPSARTSPPKPVGRPNQLGR
jgi:hypothetical protein